MFLSRKYAAKLAAVHRMRFIEHVAVTTLNLDRRARTHCRRPRATKAAGGAERRRDCVVSGGGSRERNRAALTTAYGAGLRVGKVARLTPGAKIR
jgi:hypothetical protein